MGDTSRGEAMTTPDKRIRDAADINDDRRMNADLQSSLDELHCRSKHGLVAHMLELQASYQLNKPKSLDWLCELKCLSRYRPSRKRRRGQPTPDASDARLLIPSDDRGRSGSYVAVSYPWDASASPTSVDDPTEGAWRVQDTQNEEDSRVSKARNIVLDRAIAYAEYQNLYHIWIDKECIPQEESEEKEQAMQSMDLVYRFADRSVALLFEPINTQDELDLLHDLLVGHSFPKRKDTLQILKHITSDPWWERAWTFQEDYCAGPKMNFLIPHHPSLSKNKKLFGSLPGELVVKSLQFREAATEFCGSYLFHDDISDAESTVCESILSKAGKYTILLDNSDGNAEFNKAMTTQIFEDLAAKRAKVPSDLLAIAANCCGYDVRLDTRKIKSHDCSLSVSTIALYLLNGEIFKNKAGDVTALTQLTALDYLDEVSLDSFNIPQPLSFLKICRFVSPRLSRAGVITKGRLWKLDHSIRTDNNKSFQRILKWYGPDSDRFCDIDLLHQLVKELELQGFNELADQLETFINDEYNPDPKEQRPELPSRYYKNVMADTIAEAIRHGNALLLGRLPDEEQDRNSYSGLFVSGDEWDRNHQPQQHIGHEQKTRHAFTAWRPNLDQQAALERAKQDKFVSLEVELDGEDVEGRPLLRTRRWMNGLCFFSRESATDATFPWPPGLT